MSAQVGRLNYYHSTKRQVLGNNAGTAAPAWKPNQQMVQGRVTASAKGSKILLSMLPLDVNEVEVESLFKKTVGPTKEVFIVYNSAGMSKGMAIVSFHRPEDAYIARQKYNRKIIDGRRPIMIEIIKDEDQTQVAPLQAPNRPPSLLERLGGVLPLGNGTVPAPVPSQHHPKVQPVAAKAGGMTTIAARKQHQAAQRMQGVAAHPAHQVAAAPRQKVRAKKGPKRLKKTLEQLDSEMDDYRARTDDPAAMKVS